jgi:hypothetical protein
MLPSICPRPFATDSKVTPKHSILCTIYPAFTNDVATELNYDRYKFAVQVFVGERRDQGVR